MAILRTIRDKNYVTISNDIVQDPTLSYEAKGLLVELLSRPSDWEIHRKQLLREGCADEKLKRIMDELRHRGYLYLFQGNTAIGFLSIWIASDTPKSSEEFLEIVKSSAKVEMIPGFVYFIGDGHGNVKIGRTGDWKRRLSDSIMSPEAKVLLVVHCNDSEKLEADLHQRFAGSRVKGEWFQIGEPDIQVVRSEHLDELVEEAGHTENPDAPTGGNHDGPIIGSTNKDLHKEEGSVLRTDSPQVATVVAPSRVSSKVFDHESAPYLLADTLLALVEKGPRPKTYARYTSTAEGREAVIQNFAYSFDLVLRVDNHPIEEVTDLLGWSQKDNFWKNNIRSGDAFRRHYDKMIAQMRERGFGTAPVPDDANPELTKDIIGVFRQLTNNPGFKPNAEQLGKFIEASSRCERFFRRRVDIERRQWADLLRDCIEKFYLNESHIVYPGHMCSDNTWNILMPQYLAQAGLE